MTTNTEARDALAAEFPRLTWRLSGIPQWAAVCGTSGDTEIKVTPPDDYILVRTWRCSVRSMRGATAYTTELVDDESIPDLVRRTVREFGAWVDSVRDAVDPFVDTSLRRMDESAHAEDLKRIATAGLEKADALVAEFQSQIAMLKAVTQ